MKLELFMKDLHLIQEAGRSMGPALPLTDVAERLYAAAAAVRPPRRALAVVVKALASSAGARRS
jgi:3-hydroxyisobutyrate dehydrogenase-like beta-hydroxyacid dehydrogenase